MTQKQFEKIQLAINILHQLPPEIHPRIGGSCALFFYGKANDFNDIDILVDSLVDVDLPYPRLPLKRPNDRLNETKKYQVDDYIVEVHESVMPKATGLLEPEENILCCRQILKRFCKSVYNESVTKWD